MYETLANRYRPQTLEDVVEQDVVKKTLKHQLEKEHFQHAMLFSGLAGTGKTSNARIFARAINGGSGAYTEINAAVRNKVEDIRDLVEEAQFAPLGAKYRVYIVDECFSGDTEINTPDGAVLIKDIKVGDVVYNMTGTGTVTAINTKYLDEIVVVTFSDDVSVKCSCNHLFMTQVGWVPAQNLTNQHRVFTDGYDLVSNKPIVPFLEFDETTNSFVQDRELEQEFINRAVNYVTVKSVEKQKNEMLLYDLSVDSHPSYFANGVLVHNCHMLTIQAWNAFLKLLEEPPKHAIFILCTTDPQKIPDTILSRTQRYEFKRISFKGIVDRLEYVLNCEKSGQNLSGVESWDKSALEYIAKSSKGGMRSALTLLDKCLAYSPILTAESVAKVAGVADCAQMIELLKTVQENKAKHPVSFFS